jgi:AraC-like DNA-binding protein
MEKDCKVINYSDIFLSCFSGNACRYTPKVQDHGLVYVLSGKLEINEDGELTYFHKGECAFIRKDNRVSIAKMPKGNEQFKSIWLSFPRPFLREIYQVLDKSQIPEDVKRHKGSVQKLPLRPDIASLFESMTPYFDSETAPAPEIIKLKLTEGVYVLLNTDKNFYSSLFDFSEAWKIDILDYMNENYMYNLSIKEIASFTGRSLAAFKRDFMKVSDLSPQKWIIHKRLEVARLKLKNKEAKVSEVCFEVGFKSLSHFSKAYKETFGDAPSGRHDLA